MLNKGLENYDEKNARRPSVSRQRKRGFVITSEGKNLSINLFSIFLEVSVHAPSVSLSRACNPLISFTKSIDTHNHLILSQLTYNPIFCNNLCRFRSQYDHDNKVSNIARNCFDTCSLKAVSVVLPTRIVLST